jgi:hypothetical protein
MSFIGWLGKMLKNKYGSLVTELTSFIIKHNELELIKNNAEFDLKWRLTQLYNSVTEEDEQKFIDISGLHGHLVTTAQKKEIAKREKELEKKQENFEAELSEYTQINKKTTDKTWAKSLYRRAVRRCHPDTLKLSDDDYKKELTELYQNITESYENSNLDILMVETYKLFIKPKEVIRDQIEILETSKEDYCRKIKIILESQEFVWSTFNDIMKEEYLINVMKQRGVRFVDKQKVKEILKRKIVSRKIGERPKNKLRERVKNKN